MNLDKNAKLVLEQFIKDNREYTDVNLAHFLQISDLDLIDKAINDLLELQLIKIKYSDLDYTSYVLTNKGKFYFQTNFKDKFDKYLFPIILSVISYLLGLVSGLIVK